MLFQKESPHWLIRQGREDEARDVLRRVRNDGDIDQEIREVHEISQRQGSYRDLISPRVRPLVMVGVLLAVFQQITGINTVIYYAPILLQGARARQQRRTARERGPRTSSSRSRS
jgi:hypothetical protein